METSKRRLLLILGGIFLAACLCFGLIGIGGAGFFIVNRQITVATSGPTVIWETQVVEPGPIEEQPILETPTTIPSDEPTLEINSPETPPATTQATAQATARPSSAELSPEIANQMDEIQEQVVELRGLQPNGEATRALLTPAELRQHVETDFLKDYSEEEARDDTIVLVSFGLLESGFDLFNFYQELYSEQIAGFYDNETKEMYVVQGEGFKGPQRLTYAHEYTHVLQDFNYDIEKGLGYSDEACEKDTERCAAIQSLIEGDASTLELEWFTNFATPQDWLEIQDFYNTYESPVFDNAPAFMKKDFLFPYESGQAFVQHLHDQGGWAAVDRAYRNLPVSTEQILHPEHYPDDKPITVKLPDLAPTLGTGWREIDRGVMGEWYTYLILGEGIDAGYRLETSEAQAAAEGWGGDAYVVYNNDEIKATAMVLSYVWESESEADQFGEAFHAYATLRFGQPQSEGTSVSSWDDPKGYSEFHTDGKETTWILTSDQETVQAIWKAIQNP